MTTDAPPRVKFPRNTEHAFRRGQEAGEIRSANEGGGPRTDSYMRAGKAVRVERPVADDSKKSPSSFGIPRDELARGPYAMTDGVTDEQFEAAAEGSLSLLGLEKASAGMTSSGRRAG